ncbi:MAG: YdcF family protein [Nodularia sp. CChRGM 3473]
MRTKNRQAPKLPNIRLIKRQEMWILTAQGWVIFLAITAALMFFSITHLYPFLAVTSPIQTADVLVVEGWISDYAIAQAFAEFKSGSYQYILTLGSSVEQGSYLVEYKNFAEIAAATLNKMGVPQDKLVTIPTPDVIKDRTNASAVALLQKISDANLPIKSINLVTSDAHAHRSWLIFRNVLAPKIQVGIIAAEPSNYDPNNWWNSSEGVRTIISETIAYVYALLCTWKT